MVRVLIVDDSKAMQHIIRRGLDSAGFSDIETLLVSSAEEALKQVKQWQPDLILSDWHMPEMTGLDLVRALSREQIDTKVGFVTTETSETRIQEAREAGVQFIVNKPFDVTTLVSAVSPVIDQIRAAQTKQLPTLNVESGELKGQSGDRGDALSLPSVEVLEEAINRIGSREVFMEPMDKINFTNASLPGLLVVLADRSSNQIRAVAILDLSAASLLGGSFINMNEEKVQQAISRGLIQSEISNACERMFERLCEDEQLDLSVGGSRLEVMRFSQIQKIFPKLQAMLNTPSDLRIDCDIAAIGYGQGAMTIVLPS
tara:strand:+ start:4251 stop:5195 length:945 start_codon:yes stop_codon:yes gene_type:complete